MGDMIYDSTILLHKQHQLKGSLAHRVGVEGAESFLLKKHFIIYESRGRPKLLKVLTEEKSNC